MSPVKRELAGAHLTFSLSAQIEELRNDEGYLRSGRIGRTLVKSGHLRITLTLIADGVEVGTHQAETPMTLQVLEGGLQYRVEGGDRELGEGQLLFFGPGHARDIRAVGNTALLLTIVGAEAPDM